MSQGGDQEVSLGPNTSPQQWSLGTSTALFNPLDRAGLERARAAGITHVEIVLRSSDPEPGSKQAVVEWANDLGMTVHSVHLPFNWEWDISETDEAKRKAIVANHLRLLQEAAEWRPATAIIHPSYEPIPDPAREERIRACREGLYELGQGAAELGILLCAECLPRTCLGNTSAEVLQLVDGIPGVAVCCDVNHLLKETPQAFIRAVGDRIKAVHISDYDGVDERHWVPGKGVIDWTEVIAALSEAGFPGPFMFEVVSRAGQEPVDPMVLGEWWRRIVPQRV